MSSLRRRRQSLEPASGPRLPQRRGAGPSSRGRVGERGGIRVCDESGAEAVEVGLEPHAAMHGARAVRGGVERRRADGEDGRHARLFDLRGLAQKVLRGGARR